MLYIHPFLASKADSRPHGITANPRVRSVVGFFDNATCQELRCCFSVKSLADASKDDHHIAGAALSHIEDV